ncbi:hypothetical protein BYT27DRAFT_7246966 [Phlegmacium glaucopus]|nr:hypothetical protein BYT27DRAFT_7246966 [Phlegmacium glaucopus]
MNKHITILFLLSLAFAVLSAPVVTTHTAAKRGKCSGRKRSPSVSSVSSGSHAPGVHKLSSGSRAPGLHKLSSGSRAPGLHKRSPEPDDSSIEHLYRRAPQIQLCGMNFRGSAASNCGQSMGFINGVWKAHGTFATGGLECDHILELQLIKTALANAGFCTAWQTIETKWAAKDPSAGAKARMKVMFDAGLKLTSNPPSKMMWVDETFNGEKGAFFTAKVKATPTTTAAPANIKAYYNANVKAEAASIAVLVDKEASELLGRVVAAATEGYECDPENPGPHDGYVTELENIQLKFPSKPVYKLWEKVAAYL